MPEITVEKLWSDTYQPWLVTDYPWLLSGLQDDIQLVITSPDITYGYVVGVDAQSLVISLVDVIVPQDAVFPTHQDIITSLSSPSVILTVGQWIIESKASPAAWNNAVPTVSNWTVTTESFDAKWKYSGKTWLWGELSSPWVATYFPWQETNGERPIYTNVSKPITIWA